MDKLCSVIVQERLCVSGIERGLIVQASCVVCILTCCTAEAEIHTDQSRLQNHFLLVLCVVQCACAQTFRSHALPESDRLDDCKPFISIVDSARVMYLVDVVTLWSSKTINS